MTLGLAQLAQFTLGAVLIILLPGPNSLFVATTAARHRRRAGWEAAAGIFVGDGALMVLAVLGAGTLLSGGSVAFRVLSALGGAYLGFLAVGLIRRGLTLLREQRALTRGESTAHSLNPVDSAAHPPSSNARSPFRRSLMTSLLNPKAILFFAAFFVQFVRPGEPHLWANFAVLVVLMQAVSMLYLGTIIAVSSRVHDRVKAHPHAVAWAHVGAGTAFAIFAIRLLSSAA